LWTYLETAVVGKILVNVWIVEKLNNERRGGVAGSEKENLLAGSCQSHVEEATLFGVRERF
jgi:hypothetical protein